MGLDDIRVDIFKNDNFNKQWFLILVWPQKCIPMIWRKAQVIEFLKSGKEPNISKELL